ncbi:MAG: biopolymer transporter ExbD [Phycisphaerales bacterium]
MALIDVCLFLLLYFMIAGTFAGEESSLASTLSAGRAGGGGSGSTLAVQVLRVQMSGEKIQYRLGGRSLADRGALHEVLVALPKDVGMVIKVDDEVPVAGAAGAIQACKDAGFKKVTYVAGR